MQKSRISTCRRLKLDPYLSPGTKKQFKLDQEEETKTTGKKHRKSNSGYRQR
jgi:hypothetical protein